MLKISKIRFLTLFISAHLTFTSLQAFADQSMCPPDQHWDDSMKMCMPDSPSVDPTSYKGVYQNVFSKYCISCHMAMGPNEPPEAGIDFSSFRAMMQANQNTTNSHAPFIVAKDPDHSKLYHALKNRIMPRSEDPSETPPKLPDNLIEDVRVWINNGALDN